MSENQIIERRPMSEKLIPDSEGSSDDSSSSNENFATKELEFNKEMEKYGINRVLIPMYHYKTYRYTNLEDAISQAKRDEK